MRNKIFISVIIPSYNRAQLSLVAVESVLNQTYSDFEIILVDDGSTDETYEVFSRLATERRFGNDEFRYIREENQGQSIARNRGISEARGKWVAFLDSDDIWLPEKLQWQVRAIETYGDDCGAYFTDAELLNNIGRNVTAFQSAGRVYKEMFGVSRETIPLARAFGGPWIQTLLARTDLVKKIGGFDSELHFAEDHDLLFRLSLITSYCYINLPLARIDRSGAGSSAATRRWEQTEFRLNSRRCMFEKWLALTPQIPPDVIKVVKQNLRATHSAWANCCLQSGRYRDACDEIRNGLRHDITAGLFLKWILARTSPSFAKRIVPKSKSYFELV